MTWIGVFAGQGELPRLLVERALARGLGVVVASLGARRARAPCAMAGAGAGRDGRVRWVDVAEAGWDEAMACLQAASVHDVYAVGKVHRLQASTLLEQAAAQDVLRLLADGQGRGDEALSRAVARVLEGQGFRLAPQRELLEDLLFPAGVLSRRAPTHREQRDLERGMSLARGIAALDIGQTVVVKDGVVLAVEAAAEGTDATIRRAGRLGGSGAVVAKVSRPRQDPRFDTPVVGPRTVRTMAGAGASCLAVEAGCAFLLHRERTLKVADEAGIAVVGVQRAGGAR
ncbi:UDP-2,3-diacylglucosamine diphosphatase LpxI [Carboxydochorda subterranea]|uniref:UDP-2,3-diacylglucosamine diphosphatase LpxI n=1 Tax=Carboxydichorda subterranea TaxID=3109565 RepID=A0ABZ1BVT7_9FIRM|nr:UDP-2,3-diacylglucosamine diphosphatase LpxI [Limnochorda sp. L945t]WRP16901.1 UDP-2,3-diacylglucosamine diphosphatase LpxI [Limnochorda sp. L945t]